MFIDARRIPDGARVEADLCIVGAGAAGIALAHQFLGREARVCVLESGGLKQDRETQSLYEGESVGLNYELGTTRARFFGGSTNIWSGYCRPLEAYHFAPRPWVPHSGWPIDLSDLQTYYEKATEFLGLDMAAYSTAPWQEAFSTPRLRVISPSRDRVVSSVYQRATSRRRFRRAFRREMERARNVQTYLYANAVDVRLSADARRVEAIAVACLEGSRFTVSAKHYVLAMGGIENARLLLASDTTMTCGIGNEHDLVGRFFMEHPRARVGTMIFPDGTGPTNLYDSRYAVLNLPVVADLGLSEDTQRAEHLLDVSTHIEAAPVCEDTPGVANFISVYKDLKIGKFPEAAWRKTFGVLSGIGSVSRFVLGYTFRQERFIQDYGIIAKIEQSPNPDSRITLSRSSDRLGVPRVRLDWRMNELDRRTFERTVEILEADIAGVRIDPEFRSVLDSQALENLRPEWTWHHIGTTRMHDDPRQGVVDRNCRVHGLENLFVAGSSVFPTAGKNVPTLTIVALAIRLASFLEDRLGR